jgi:catechol 2,3-dioxygenase-like lactoylglutathione lyase family enzyme
MASDPKSGPVTDAAPAMHRGGINHLDLTVLDPVASARFYDAVLGFMGFERKRLAQGATHLPLYHSTEQGQRLFSIALQTARRTTPHDRYSPGLHHVAFSAASREDVDGLHALLVDLRATVLDPPAEYPAYAPGYYAVFFADPDGLKLEFVHMPAEPAFAP